MKLLGSMLLLSFFLYGCGQKRGPSEIVRLQKGSSLMRQVAPTLKRGSSNIFLVGQGVTDKQLNKYLNRHNRVYGDTNSNGFQKLYVSGPKAKSKRDLRSRFSKINNRRHPIGNSKNIQDHLHKK